MKHNIGDLVRYTNKNMKFDCTGYIVGIERFSNDFIIKPMIKYNHWVIYDNVERGTNRVHPNTFTAPRFSKNLVKGLRDYDPSQNGDLDSDI